MGAPKEKARAEATEPEAPATRGFEWENQRWEVPPSLDDMPYEGVVAWSRVVLSAKEDDRSLVPQVHLDDFLQAALGPRQHARLVRGRKLGEINDFVGALFVHWGTSTGE